MKKYLSPIFLIVITPIFCTTPKFNLRKEGLGTPDKFIVVLGVAQDGGYPHIGCEKNCCKLYYENKESKKLVTCLALVDKSSWRSWMFEATPDIALQMHNLKNYVPNKIGVLPDGIFVTHAHIGHYAGLMQLGREAMSSKNLPVFVMPRMDSFLRNNGPWSQLVNLNNISINQINDNSLVQLTDSLKVTPFRVPHRDEYSETVGYTIESNKKKVLFIPDIDKWKKWDKDIIAEIKKVDIAFLDATFFNDKELSGRNMQEVPHPLVEESIKLFSTMPQSEKNKIIFIHFNHTNPLIRLNSEEKKYTQKAGFGVAEEGMIIGL